MSAPANDLCADAELVSALPFTVTLDTTEATDDAATPDSEWGSGDSHNGVWYTWTAPAGVTRLSLTLDDEDFEAIATVFTGACGSLVDTIEGGFSDFTETFTVTPGETYYFLITSYDAGGMAAVTFTLEHPEPSGQLCAVLTCDDGGRYTLRNALKGVDGPLYWSTLAHRDASGNAKRFPWAPISIADPASYQDGYKEGILLSIGEIACPLSDRNGRMQVPTCDVTYWDGPDRDGLMKIRGFIGNELQKALRGKEFTIYTISDADRRLLKDPIIAFRGYVARCNLPADYQFTIHAEGWIAKRLKSTLWTTKLGQIFPLAPPETFQIPAPVAFGRLSDEGSDAGPVVFVDDEAGRGGAGGYPNPLSSYGDIATPPAGLSAVEAAGLGNIDLGDNPGDAYYVMYTRVVAGVESDPDPFLPTSITPVVISGDNAAIDATGTNDGADSYRFYIGRIFTGLIAFSHYIETADAATGVRFTDFPTLASQAATPITPGAKFAINPYAYVGVMAIMSDGTRTAMFPGAVYPTFGVVNSLGYNRPVRFAVTPLAGAVSYEFYFKRSPINPFQFRFIVPASQVNLNGDIYWEYDWSASGYEIVDGAPNPQGYLTPFHVGKFTDLNGYTEWEGFVISARPCFEYISAYLDGVRVDDARYGSGGDFLAPGKSGYTASFGDPFTIGGFTPCIMFVRGPAAAAILGTGVDVSGDPLPQVTLRVNVHGHENVAGDDVETSIYEIFRMLAKNNLVADAPTLIGDWDQEPIFTDGAARVDDASIDQAAEDGLAVIPGGPNAARWLFGDMTVEELLQDICPSAKMKYGIAPNGQLVACVHNPDAAAVFEAGEATEIVDQTFSIEATDQGFANATPYQYANGYDETGAVELVDGATEEDAVSQSAEQHGVREPEADPFSFAWRNGTLARQVARAFLRESAYLPQPAQGRSALHWIHRKPGEVGSVTHRQGATATGYLRRKHAILGMRIDLEDLSVGLMMLDLRTGADALSFYQYEDIMAGRYIGGSRSDSCYVDGGIDVPFGWFVFQIDWDEVPGTHGQRARILTATAAGNVKPSIFLEGEDPSGDTAVVEGTNNASSTFDEQVLGIPRGAGVVRYWMLPELSGGAVAADAKMYGFLEGYRL